MDLTQLLNLSGYHSIQSLAYFPSIFEFFEKMKIPMEILQDLYLFTVNSENLSLYTTHYQYIEAENPYRPLSFSYEDFLLAYIAAENGYSVVSYDHHLLETIHQFLSYSAYHPGDRDLIPSDEILLLDSNIFLAFYQQNLAQILEIQSMILDYSSLTFFCTNHIFNETQRVVQKMNASKNQFRKKPEGMCQQSLMDPLETDLSLYIDDFKYFESHNALRKRKRNRIRKNSFKGNLR